mmetsp:Transcript_59289/g.105400  ORF Transcript_59289/g.105400 Transcript_59289/m.105400 type:complete len:613 (+) Transcript_59289:75-1913(+)
MDLLKVFACSAVLAARSERPRNPVNFDFPNLAHMVLVDAESTGTRLISFNEDGESMTLKVDTHCTTDAEMFPLEGVSALAYPLKACQPKVTCLCSEDRTNCENLKTAHPNEVNMTLGNESHRTITAVFLLRALRGLAKTNVGSNLQPMNAKEVPIWGTAGLRYLTKEANEAIWNEFCGVNDPTAGGFTFASKGDMCGTLPGTLEAYYEFLSTVADGDSQKLMGTFTVGGGSSQIAVPLLSLEDVKGWQVLIEEVKEIFGNCATLKGKHGKPLAIFKDSDPENCYKDFIDIVPLGANNLPDHIKAKSNANLDDLRAIGVISFLGLGHDNGGRMGIAGGVSAIEAWARENGCGTDEKSDEFDFDGCQAKFFKALEKDAFFRKVVHYFRNSSLKVHDFAYASPAAIPSMALSDEDQKDIDIGVVKETAPLGSAEGLFFKVDKMKEQQAAGSSQVGRTLLDAIETQCNGLKKNHAFGYGGSNSCMKALWTSKYIQWFFDNPVHENNTLHFSPQDMSLGEYSQVLANEIKSIREHNQSADVIAPTDQNQSLQGIGMADQDQRVEVVDPSFNNFHYEREEDSALLETARSRAKLLATELAWQAEGGYQMGAMLHLATK